MGTQQSTLECTELGEPLPTTAVVESGLWDAIVPGVHRPATHSAIRKVTVFVRKAQQNDAEKSVREYLHNGIARLRQVRHPRVVHYLCSVEDDKEVRVIVERCRPLELLVDEMAACDVLQGLNDVREALVFLHDEVHICHNNVSPASVFVSDEGVWQLGGFECARSKEESRHWVTDDFARRVQQPAFMPPEDEQLRRDDCPAHARDAYSFGKIVEYLSKSFEQEVDAEQMGQIHDAIRSLIFGNAKLRPHLRDVPKHIFRNPLQRIVDFIERLPTPSDEEREQFFRSLHTLISSLDAGVIVRRLVRRLLARVVLLDTHAVEHFLPHLLAPDDVLPVEPYTRSVIPQVVRIMRVRETGVRMALLQHFPLYARHISPAQLKSVVLPELRLGMNDIDDRVCAASLRAMAECALILGGSVVTGGTHRKHLAEGRPRAPLAVADQAAVLASLRAMHTVDKVDKLREAKAAEMRADVVPIADDTIVGVASTSAGDNEWQWKEEEQNAPPPSPPLGAEFAVNAAAAEEGEEEMDYFADMTPKFDDRKEELVASPIVNRFAVADTSWGEEGAWGDEEDNVLAIDED